jgi:GYF domain 2
MGEGGSSQPQWHLSRDGKQFGPLSANELLQMAKLGKLRADDLLWKPGYDTWKPASAIPGLLKPPRLPLSDSSFTASSAQAKARADAPEQPLERTNALPPKGVKARLRFAADNFRRLWLGQQPLGQAFWLYWVAGGIGVIFLALGFFFLSGAALAKVGLNEATYDVVLGLAVLPVIAAAILYNFFAAIGAWRSASWRAGWGIVARLYILLSMSVFTLKLGAVGYALLSR